jgi:uncharacterized protein YkwD
MKTNRWLYLVLFFLFSIVSCRKNDVVSNDPPDNSAGLNESLMLQLVNQQRQAGCNCGAVYYAPTTPVTWNDQLETAALAHANDMNTNNFFDHTGHDGSSPGDRITRAGYTWRAYGENIAKGYTSEQAVMNAWIASEDHCKNLMNPSLHELGAAKVSNYWVQDFGTK